MIVPRQRSRCARTPPILRSIHPGQRAFGPNVAVPTLSLCRIVTAGSFAVGVLNFPGFNEGWLSSGFNGPGTVCLFTRCRSGSIFTQMSDNSRPASSYLLLSGGLALRALQEGQANAAYRHDCSLRVMRSGCCSEGDHRAVLHARPSDGGIEWFGLLHADFPMPEYPNISRRSRIRDGAAVAEAGESRGSVCSGGS